MDIAKNIYNFALPSAVLYRKQYEKENKHNRAGV